MNNYTLKNFRLVGKTALVTGGCGNLGPYWVSALLDAGARVVIIDLPNTRIPTDLKRITKKRLRLYDADITNINQLKDIHKRIFTDFGPVQILVNNAGIDAPPVKNAEKGSD